jgi:hypothetical protein
MMGRPFGDNVADYQKLATSINHPAITRRISVTPQLVSGQAYLVLVPLVIVVVIIINRRWSIHLSPGSSPQDPAWGGVAGHPPLMLMPAPTQLRPRFEDSPPPD